MSEAGRLARKMDEIRRGCNMAALNAARSFYGTGNCGSSGTCSGAPARDPAQKTPLESDLLDKRVRECFSGVVRSQPVPESVRIADLATRTIQESVNPLDPDTRFSIYRGPFIPPVCPDVPQEDKNANVPKQSLSRCPLPNRGYMPNLPV